MEFKATYKSNIYFVSTVGGALLKSLRLLDLMRESKAWLAQFVENDTLDASRCHAQWATAEPLLRQAALSSSICKRGRHEPNPTCLTARQSGSSVEAESKRDEAPDVVAAARCQSESRGESLLHSEPHAFRYGEVQTRFQAAATVQAWMEGRLHANGYVYDPKFHSSESLVKNCRISNLDKSQNADEQNYKSVLNSLMQAVNVIKIFVEARDTSGFVSMHEKLTEADKLARLFLQNNADFSSK